MGGFNKHDIQSWSPREATRRIRSYATSGYRLNYKRHIPEWLLERGLVMGDVFHVLKSGSVYADAKPASWTGCYRYIIEGTSPNSGGRTLGIVVIPSVCRQEIKVMAVTLGGGA